MVQVLLEASVDQDQLDSALYRSVSEGRLDLVELLVSHGADIKTHTNKEQE